jgi:hypothetical protein
VVAQRAGTQAYLVDLEDGYGGRVADFEAGTLWQPTNMQSLLARGYWEPLPGAPDDVDLSRLQDAQTVDGAAEYEARRREWLRSG